MPVLPQENGQIHHELLTVFQQDLDLLHGIADGRDGHIVVDRCNEVSGVLGAVNIEIPGTLQGVSLRRQFGGFHHA